MESENGDVVGDIFRTPTPSAKKRGPVTRSSSKERSYLRDEVAGGKSRTPSGQVLSSSVKDIRNFFDVSKPPSSLNFNWRSNASLSATEKRSSMKEFTTNSQLKSVNSVNSVTSVNSAGSRNENDNNEDWSIVTSKKGKSSQAKHNKQIQISRHDQSHFSKFAEVFSTQQDNNDNRYEEKSVNQNKQFTQDELQEDKTTAEESVYKDAEKDQRMITELEEALLQEAMQQAEDGSQPTENPQLMDVQVVLQMFKDLKQHMVKIEKSNMAKDVTFKKLEKKQQEDSAEVTKLKREVNTYKVKTEILSGVVDRLGSMYIDLERKITNVESKQMRNSLVISGLKTEAKILKCLETARQFLSQDLALEVNITDCFKLGVGEYKPIVVTVESLSHKTQIFQAMDQYQKKLKDEEIEQKIYINNYLPAGISEDRRLQREIYRENESNQATQVNMTIGRGGLHVQGEKFQKKIEPPVPTKILRYQDHEVERILKTELTPGDQFTNEGSTFFGYAIPANNLQTIEDAYIKLRILYPQAKHILCCYNVPGMPRCYYEGYCDDNETGGGRKMLQIVRNNNLRCIGIFVIRMQDGPKIGAVRFDLIEHAMRSSVKANPYNKYTNERQEIKEPDNEYLSEANGAMKTPISTNRGRAPFRNQRRRTARQLRGGLTRGQYKQNQGGYDNREGQRAGFDNPRKRRKESPNDALQSWNTDFTFQKPIRVERGDELGSSWPTLQQAKDKEL